MSEELGLIENTPKEQIKELINRKVTKKPNNPVDFLEKFGIPKLYPITNVMTLLILLHKMQSELKIPSFKICHL